MPFGCVPGRSRGPLLRGARARPAEASTIHDPLFSVARLRAEHGHARGGAEHSVRSGWQGCIIARRCDNNGYTQSHFVPRKPLVLIGQAARIPRCSVQPGPWTTATQQPDRALPRVAPQGRRPDRAEVMAARLIRQTCSSRADLSNARSHSALFPPRRPPSLGRALHASHLPARAASPHLER